MHTIDETATAYVRNDMRTDMAELAVFEQKTGPIFFPKKHTVESYRSQQRKAKKRKK